MEKINILITSAGRRVSLVNFFKKEIELLKLKSQVFCTDLSPVLSSACQVADKAFKVKKVTHKDYIDNLIDLCNENNIKLIIPTIDTELEVLAMNESKFQDNGILLLISDVSFVQKCRDKREIHHFFDSIDLKRAIEFNKEELKFPVFVKPTDGSRSVGIHLLKSKKELTKEILDNPKNMFLQYLPQNEYNEFTVDIYFNKNSQIICIVPRERIVVRDGEVNKACARKNEIIDLVQEKFKNVKGLKGCITLQVFKHKNKNKIVGIEINPRFGGGFPLSYLAGANFPKWIIQEYLLDEKVEFYQDNWKDNTLMLRYDAEVITYGFKG